MTENVKENVEKNVTESAPQKKRRRIKLPRNVVEKGGVWYVRKSITIEERVNDSSGALQIKTKQKQIWKRCEPPTKQRSEEILRELEGSIHAKKYGLRQPISNFGEVLDKFIEIELVPAQYDGNGRKITGRRSLKSIGSICETLRKYFSHQDVRLISLGEIEDFKRARLTLPRAFDKRKKPLLRSIRSVNYELTVLRQIFNFAYRRRWVERSPFLEAKNLIDVSAETKRNILWTREEEEKALALCEGKKFAHLKVTIICLVDGGFRKSELLNAKWIEIDWKKGAIPARSYKGKSLHTRPVYMTQRMKEVLVWWRKEQKGIKSISDRSRIIGYTDIKNGWNTIRDKINRPDLRLHDLRHCYASRLTFEGKLPITLVSRALGHSSTATTERYLNINQTGFEQIAETMDKLNET